MVSFGDGSPPPEGTNAPIRIAELQQADARDLPEQGKVCHRSSNGERLTPLDTSRTSVVPGSRSRARERTRCSVGWVRPGRPDTGAGLRSASLGGLDLHVHGVAGAVISVLAQYLGDESCGYHLGVGAVVSVRSADGRRCHLVAGPLDWESSPSSLFPHGANGRQ